MSKSGFIKKFNHQKKILRFTYLVIGLLYLISLIFFTKSVLSLVGIETNIRIIGLAFLYLFLLFFIIVGLVYLFTNRKKSFILLLFVTLIFTSAIDVGTFYIDKTYGKIDKIQKKMVEYTSAMIALKDTNEFNKIGIISAKNDPTGYVIPQDMIKKNNIKGEIVEYDDYISMLSDLYDKKIDAMFTTIGYTTMYNSYDKFEHIEDETKVVYEMSKKLENVDNVSYSTKNLTEPFTMLLMGVDATGDGLNKAASFNGDTLMLITFNPKTLSSTIFSIPRDTYVPISCRNNNESKINSSAYGGTSCVVNTIEKLTGIKIDYYVKINFTGVVKLVDDLGGIKVDVPIKFCEQDSKRRKKDPYRICLDKGEQVLNGEQALALARHRKTLPLGDFQRVQHQQLVVEAMADSLKNIRDVDAFYKILDDVINNVDTNMTTPQILSLYQVAKNILTNKLGSDAKLSIEKTYLTGYDLYAYTPGLGFVYTFQYYRQSLDEIVKAMKVNLELESPEIVKTFDFSGNTEYKKKVIGKTYYKEEKRTLLPKFVGKNKTDVDKYASEHNLEVKYTEIKSGDSGYNASLPNGYVVSQKEHNGLIVDTLKTLNISIIVNNNNGTINSGDKTIPDFTGKTLDEFNTWKKNNSEVDTTNPKELSASEIASLNIEEPKNNTIYKQSVKAGTKFSDVTVLTVYYYKEEE